MSCLFILKNKEDFFQSSRILVCGMPIKDEEGGGPALSGTLGEWEDWLIPSPILENI